MDPAIFDKNKSAYKLKNFGPLYYLNLDGQPERRQYMEDQFKYWEIENYTHLMTVNIISLHQNTRS